MLRYWFAFFGAFFAAAAALIFIQVPVDPSVLFQLWHLLLSRVCPPPSLPPAPQLRPSPDTEALSEPHDSVPKEDLVSLLSRQHRSRSERWRSLAGPDERSRPETFPTPRCPLEKSIRSCFRRLTDFPVLFRRSRGDRGSIFIMLYVTFTRVSPPPQHCHAPSSFSRGIFIFAYNRINFNIFSM